MSTCWREKVKEESLESAESGEKVFNNEILTLLTASPLSE